LDCEFLNLDAATSGSVSCRGIPGCAVPSCGVSTCGLLRQCLQLIDQVRERGRTYGLNEAGDLVERLDVLLTEA
jgi:replicative DNA helicase